MTRRVARCFVAALALGGMLAVPAVADRAQLEADLAQMLDWFGGRFDNYAQFREDESGEVEEPHGRIHSIFKPVELPAVGEHVFYVEQYADGDPAKIYRQRIYDFRINDEKQAVELVIFAPSDAEAVRGAHLDAGKLDGLTPETMRSYPGCEVTWTRHGRGTEGDHFIGLVPRGPCTVVSSRSGRTLVIMDDLYLDADEIWIQDRAEDSEGNWVYGHRGGVAHKLRKVRWFDCWAAAPKEAAESEDDDWDLWRPIEVHDQGGRHALVPPGAEQERYSFDLFNATYRGERSVDVLELAIRERGKDRSIAYAWADPASSRIGINLRVLQVGCTLDPDRRF